MGLSMIIPDEPELGIQKQCYDCNEFWPLNEEFFVRNKNSNDGFDIYCKACRKQHRLKTEARRMSFNDKRDADRQHRVQTRKRLANTIITPGEL